MRIFYLTVLLLYLAAFPTACLAGNEAASIDPRAEKLIREIEVRKSLPISHERWKFATGPWAEYLRRYLKNRITPAEHIILVKARDEGDCHKVISFLANRFLQRFPYLAPAHTKEYVWDYFKWTFIFEGPYVSYCRAKAELKLAFDLSKRHKLRVFPFYALKTPERWRPIFKKRKNDAPEDQARNTLCAAFEKLTRLALRDRHIPAIRDLIRYAGTPALIALTPEQEYMLVKTATRLGLYDPEVDELGTSSRVSIDLEKREEIDRYVTQEKRGLLPIDTYSSMQCSGTRLDPFLKLSQHQKEKQSTHWKSTLRFSRGECTRG